MSVGGMSQLELYIAYTPTQDGRILYWQIEFGPKDDDLYKVVDITQAAGTDTVTVDENQFIGTTASITYKLRISLPVADKACRISFKEDGSNNFGALTVRSLASGL